MLQVGLAGQDSIVVYRYVEALQENDWRGNDWEWTGFPFTDKGKLWIAKIRRDPGHDFVVNKYTKVCSLHFTAEDYICGDAFKSKRRVLKATAFPTIFPWTIEKHLRTSFTSKLAILKIIVLTFFSL